MPSTRVRRPRAPRWHPVEIAAVLAAALYLLWPLLRRGDLLGRDLIFAPYAKLDFATLGLSGAAPRAVPLDLVVALGTSIFGSQLTARLALVGTVLLVVGGMRRVLARASLPARLCGMTISVVNPFVVERLGLGQWALIAAYGALLWILVGTRDFLRTGRFAAAGLGLWVASLTPTGGVLAVLTVALVVLFDGGSRARSIGAIGASVLAQGPWVIAAFIGGAELTSDPTGMSVFAAHPQRAGSVIFSLLTGSGIWNSEVVPASQRGPLGWAWLALAVAVAVLGWHRARNYLGSVSTPLLVLVGLGLALAIVPTFDPGAQALEWASAHIPGAGLLRDSQKWVAAYMLLIAVLAAAATERVSRSLSRVAVVFACVAAIAVPYALLPDAGVVLRSTLHPVDYSDEWAEARTHVGPHDTTLVIPAGGYRNFRWLNGRPSLDPAPRLLPGTVLVDDALIVGGVRVHGESAAARRAMDAISGPSSSDALARLGVTLVLIEHGTPGAAPQVPGQIMHSGQQLTVVRVSSATSAGLGGGAGAAAVGAHCVYLLLLVASVGEAGRRAAEKRLRKSPETTGE